MSKDFRANFFIVLCCLFVSFQLVASDLETAVFDVGITCPGDKWVDCDAELWSLYEYGHAYFKDYNGTYRLPEPVEHWYLNDCNTGYITRTWKHKSYGRWYECTQTIHVGNTGYGSEIHWPKDNLVLEGCNPNILPENLPAYYNKPHYNSGSCDMMIHTYKDQQFSFGGGCKKIIRKWTVINWCEYVPNSYPKKGYFEHYQTIKIINNEAPHAYENPVIEVNSSDCDGGYVEIPELTVSGQDCNDGYKITNSSPYSTSNGADASGVYPVGTHTIYYSVEYACGSSKTFSQVVKVINTSAPVPICLSGVSIALMPVDEDRDGVPEDGSVLIWAKDIDFKSYSPCGLELTYSFSADSLVMSTEFTCAHVGVNELSVYVTDENGKQSYCQVGLFVQNNAANIPNCNANGVDEDAADADQDGANDNDDQDGGEESDGEQEVSGEHETEDVEDADVPDDQEAEQEDEELAEEQEAAEGDGEDHEGESADSTDIPDSTDVSMIYGNFVSMHGDAINASIMFEGDAEVAGQIEFESVLITTILDSFINDAGETLYITDFSYEDVPIEGSGESRFSKEAFVKASGEYLVTDVPLGQMVTIDPQVAVAEYLSNVNTADGILLFEHLTGINRITDPYVLLSADIDGDMDIDFDDVEYLVDYIAESISSLPNEEWIFVDGSYQFESDQAPWAEAYFTDEIFVENATYEQDYIAVQIGDLGDIDLENRTTIEELRRQIDEYLNRTFVPEINVSPNPFTNEINIEVTSEKTEAGQLYLYDVSGKLLMQRNLVLSSGQHRHRISFENNQFKGTIIYRLISPSHEYKGKLVRLN